MSLVEDVFRESALRPIQNITVTNHLINQDDMLETELLVDNHPQTENLSNVVQNEGSLSEDEMLILENELLEETTADHSTQSQKRIREELENSNNKKQRVNDSFDIDELEDQLDQEDQKEADLKKQQEEDAQVKQVPNEFQQQQEQNQVSIEQNQQQIKNNSPSINNTITTFQPNVNEELNESNLSTSSSSSTFSINELSNEIVLSIFSNGILTVRDLARCLQVSKSWRDKCNVPRVWRVACLSDWNIGSNWNQGGEYFKNDENNVNWKGISQIRQLLSSKRKYLEHRIEEGYSIMAKLLHSRHPISPQYTLGDPHCYDKIKDIMKTMESDVILEKFLRRFEGQVSRPLRTDFSPEFAEDFYYLVNNTFLDIRDFGVSVPTLQCTIVTKMASLLRVTFNFKSKEKSLKDLHYDIVTTPFTLNYTHESTEGVLFDYDLVSSSSSSSSDRDDIAVSVQLNQDSLEYIKQTIGLSQHMTSQHLFFYLWKYCLSFQSFEYIADIADYLEISHEWEWDDSSSLFIQNHDNNHDIYTHDHDNNNNNDNTTTNNTVITTDHHSYQPPLSSSSSRYHNDTHDNNNGHDEEEEGEESAAIEVEEDNQEDAENDVNNDVIESSSFAPKEEQNNHSSSSIDNDHYHKSADEEELMLLDDSVDHKKNKENSDHSSATADEPDDIDLDIDNI